MGIFDKLKSVANYASFKPTLYCFCGFLRLFNVRIIFYKRAYRFNARLHLKGKP